MPERLKSNLQLKYHMQSFHVRLGTLHYFLEIGFIIAIWRRYFMSKLKEFFFPPANSPRWMYILPLASLVILVIMVVVAGTTAGTTPTHPCSAGPPVIPCRRSMSLTLNSPHANVTCEECHIGRASFADQLMRKSQGLKEIYYMIFAIYILSDPCQSSSPSARHLRDMPSARTIFRRQPAGD